MPTSYTQHDIILNNIHNYNINIKTREIFLHSAIDGEEEGGVDYRSAINLEKNLRLLDGISRDPILIHMHLPGGDWEDCMAMYDTIQMCKSHITILAYGKIQSASSILLQAPDLRILMPNSTTLIHYGSISLDGEHKAATSALHWSAREAAKMIDIFADRCIKGQMAVEKNWKKFIAKKHIEAQLSNKSDWILNAEETVHYGFADGILGQRKYMSIDSLKKHK